MDFLLSFMPAACKFEPELYVGMFWHFYMSKCSVFPHLSSRQVQKKTVLPLNVFSELNPGLVELSAHPAQGLFLSSAPNPPPRQHRAALQLLYHICTDRAYHWLSFVFLMPIFLIIDLWLSANQLHFWGSLLDFGCQAEFFLTVHNNSNSLTSTMRQLTFLKLSASGSASERFPLQNRQLPLLNNLLLFNLILVPK